jgi:uncharacterized UPF0146 family protein
VVACHKYPDVPTDTRPALVRRLADADPLVEIGVGRRPAVARALAERGVSVTVTDVRDPREAGVTIPDTVRFVRDDVVAASEAADPHPCYRAEAYYALNCPPELHRPIRTLARRHDADLLFTTLGGDQPAIPVARETLPGETLFVARSGP